MKKRLMAILLAAILLLSLTVSAFADGELSAEIENYISTAEADDNGFISGSFALQEDTVDHVYLSEANKVDFVIDLNGYKLICENGGISVCGDSIVRITDSVGTGAITCENDGVMDNNSAVWSSGNSVVTLDGVTITGFNTYSEVIAAYGSEFYIEEGTVITENHSARGGTGMIRVSNNGVLVMNGGEISNNTVENDDDKDNCGLVSVDKGARFEMNGGSIINNVINADNGDTIDLETGSAHMKVSGNAVIKGNTKNGEDYNLTVYTGENCIELGQLGPDSEIHVYDLSAVEKEYYQAILDKDAEAIVKCYSKMGEECSLENAQEELNEWWTDGTPEEIEEMFNEMREYLAAPTVFATGYCNSGSPSDYFISDNGDYDVLKISEDGELTFVPKLQQDAYEEEIIVPNPHPAPAGRTEEPDILPSAETVNAEPETIVSEIKDIEEKETPLSEALPINNQPQSVWALANVVLAVLSFAAGLMAVVSKKENLRKIVGCASSVGAAVTLLLTSNFAGSMVMTDRFTLLMAAFAAVNALALIIKDKKEA